MHYSPPCASLKIATDSWWLSVELHAIQRGASTKGREKRVLFV